MLIIDSNVVHVTDIEIVLRLVQIVQVATVVKIPSLNNSIGVSCEESPAIIVQSYTGHCSNVIRVNLVKIPRDSGIIHKAFAKLKAKYLNNK